MTSSDTESAAQAEQQISLWSLGHTSCHHVCATAPGHTAQPAQSLSARSLPSVLGGEFRAQCSIQLNSAVPGLAWLQGEVLPVFTPGSASAQSCAQRAASALGISPGPAHPEQLFQHAEAQSNAHIGSRSFSTILVSTSSLQTSLRTTAQY